MLFISQEYDFCSTSRMPGSRMQFFKILSFEKNTAQYTIVFPICDRLFIENQLFVSLLDILYSHLIKE